MEPITPNLKDLNTQTTWTSLSWSLISAQQPLATSSETKSCRSRSLNTRVATFSNALNSEVFSLPTTKKWLDKRQLNALKTWTKLKSRNSRRLKHSRSRLRHGRERTNSTKCQTVAPDKCPTQSVAKLVRISSSAPQTNKVPVCCAPPKQWPARLAPSNTVMNTLRRFIMINRCQRSASVLPNCLPSLVMKWRLDLNQIRSSAKIQCNWTQWWWAMLCKGLTYRLKSFLKGLTVSCDRTSKETKRQGSAPAKLKAMALQQLLWKVLRRVAWCKSTLVTLKIVRA